MTGEVRVWLRAALWGIGCSVLLTSAGIVERGHAGDGRQLAQSNSTSTPIGDFGSWSARWFTSSDGSKACSLDNKSAPSPSGDRQWLTITWSKRQGASFIWFEPSPKLSQDDVVTFAVGRPQDSRPRAAVGHAPHPGRRAQAHRGRPDPLDLGERGAAVLFQPAIASAPTERSAPRRV